MIDLETHGLWAEKPELFPKKANQTDTGYDIFVKEDMSLKAFTPTIIPTGVYASLPDHWWIWVSDRTSSFLKGLVIHQGWVDESYCKEIGILAWSLKDIDLKANDRIAQITFLERPVENLWMINKLSNKPQSSRGAYGSTGQ